MWTNETQAESNITCHKLLILHFLNYFMKTRNEFSVAVTYIRRRFGVPISLKHVARQDKSSYKENWLQDETETLPTTYKIPVNNRWVILHKTPLKRNRKFSRFRILTRNYHTLIKLPYFMHYHMQYQ